MWYKIKYVFFFIILIFNFRLATRIKCFFKQVWFVYEWLTGWYFIDIINFNRKITFQLNVLEKKNSLSILLKMFQNVY